MSNMRCPFCNELLIITNKNLVSCQNLHCEIGNLPMPLIVVKEIARTKKQLEIAVDALKSAKKRLELINNSKFANLNNVLQIQSQCEILKIDKALEQIKELDNAETHI